MKRILIISDTHKNQVLFRKAFQNEENITHIFHLGDFYEDMDDNIDLTEYKQIYKVPGLFHPKYLDKTFPNSLRISLDNWQFLLVHFLDDVKRLHNDLDVVFYGHTHRWNWKQIDGISFVNPGHLKNHRDRGREASYVVADVHEDKLVLHWKNLKKEEFFTKTINR